MTGMAAGWSENRNPRLHHTNAIALSVWFLVPECGDEAVEGVSDQQQPGVGGVTLHPRHLRAEQRRGDLPQLPVRLAATQQVKKQQVQTVQE